MTDRSHHPLLAPHRRVGTTKAVRQHCNSQGIRIVSLAPLTCAVRLRGDSSTASRRVKFDMNRAFGSVLVRLAPPIIGCGHRAILALKLSVVLEVIALVL